MRCMQELWQGLLVWQQEEPSEFDLAYADFLSPGISMLRLFETFLETAPQFTLVLAVMLQSGRAEYYQCQERESKAWSITTLSLQSWAKCWAHITSQATLSLSRNFNNLRLGERSLTLSWGDKTVFS
nr:XK-related protein 8-like isoform X2 [Symphalangus syndactylus]